MTSTEVAFPEASLSTNLEGCGFARGGGDIERADAVAGKRAAQPEQIRVRGRTFFILGALSIVHNSRLTSDFSAKFL